MHGKHNNYYIQKLRRRQLSQKLQILLLLVFLLVVATFFRLSYRTRPGGNKTDSTTKMRLILTFLLEGKVQSVKMRRYIESAGKHFGLGGFVINTQSGAVYGEAWEVTSAGNDSHGEPESSSSSNGIDQFKLWIQGRWEPKVYTNIKPTRKLIAITYFPHTPKTTKMKTISRLRLVSFAQRWYTAIISAIGTAYPALARVDHAAIIFVDISTTTTSDTNELMKRFESFTMVRDDVEANEIAMERMELHSNLVTMIDESKHNNNNNKDGNSDVVSWPPPPPK